MPNSNPAARIGRLKFAIHTITALTANPSLLPAGPGVYVAIFPRGNELLNRWGYFDQDSSAPLTVAGHPVLYVGMTKILGIPHRIDNHARGDARVSTLRMTLGTLLRKELSLGAVTTPKKSYFHFGAGEERLTEWMSRNVLFGIRACDDPATLERHIIQDRVVPLNISDRRAHPFSRRLMSMRREMIKADRARSVRVGPRAAEIRDWPDLSRSWCSRRGRRARSSGSRLRP
jgi:hypothetical protein